MQIPQDRPVYRILSEQGFYGPDDCLYAQGQIIAFDDEPNEEMEPMNELARDKLTEYLAKLDALAAKAAAAKGMTYAGRPRTMDEKIAFAKIDSRRVELVKGDGGVPLMGGKKRGRPPRVISEVDTTPDTGVRGKLSLAKTEA